MYILGIDPGVQNMGLAYLNTKTKLIDRNFVYEWKNSYRKLLSGLLAELGGVTEVAIEKPFFTALTLANNIRTLEVIGIIKLAIETYNSINTRQIHITEYSPATIKKEFTGSGKAKKEDIIKEVKNKFGIELKTTHEADAIAIAYTHYVKCSRLHSNK